MRMMERTHGSIKTEAQLQNEIKELKSIAEEKLRIWQAAKTAPTPRGWLGWQILRRLWRA
jgi:hypothetical protein